MTPPAIGRRERTRALWRFVAANFALSLWIASPYLDFGPARAEWGAWAFTRVAFLSHFASLAVVLGLVLWPLIRLTSSRAVLLTLPPLLMFLYQFVLMVDVRIYALFRFHLNGLVLNTLTTAGSWDSVTLGRGTMVTSAIVLTALAVGEWWTMRAIVRAFSRGTAPAPSARRWAPVVAWTAIALVVATDKFGFAYANFHDRLEVTRYQRLFPLYRPLLLDETFERYLGWKRDNTSIPTASPSGGLLRYPLAAPDLSGDVKRWNIVWIALESWRFDMFDERITPNLTKFAQRGRVFERHFSGGNATRFGIFSLFYGVHGTYWHQFLAERQSPVFLDALQKLGYEAWVASSTQLSYPEFRSTAFVNLPDAAINDHLPGDGPVERDPVMAERFETFLDRRAADRPFFAFLFPDAPHAPYHYPASFERFTPASDEVNYFFLKKGGADGADAEPLKNRYRNSIGFADAVIARMLGALESRGLLDRTIVVITGDHGEEFMETGYLGHNSTFSSWQAQVPMVLVGPGVTPGRETRLTSHVDVVPTMFDLMGITADPAQYSQGLSLVGSAEHAYIVSSGWDTFGIIEPPTTIVLSSESYNARMAEVRVGPYELSADPRAVLGAKTSLLTQVARELGSFLR
ncbi:MAG: sulfatase-like hydrolase/transferase [Nitrospirota bacterium]